MNTINFTSSNTPIYNEQEKKFDKKQNLLNKGATDSIEIQNKENKAEAQTQEETQEKSGGFFSYMNLNNPKVSIPLAIATILVLGFLGNKAASKSANIGIIFEKKFLSDGSFYQKGAKLLKNGTDGIKNFLSNNKLTKGFYKDVAETFKNNPAKPVWDLVRGNGQGVVRQYADTNLNVFRNAFISNKKDTILHEASKTLGVKASSLGSLYDLIMNGTSYDDIVKELVDDPKANSEALDAIKKAFDVLAPKVEENKKGVINSFKKLFGDEAENIYSELLNGSKDDIKLSAKMLSQIQKTQNLDPADKVGLKNFIDKLTKDPQYKEFQDISMVYSGSWGPVNWINRLLEKTGKNDSKLAKKIYKYTKGNAGDSLLKYGLSDGKMTNTKLGSVLSGSVVLVTEAITNFVNDRSSAVLLSLFPLAQSWERIKEAPKEKKGATIAEEFITQSIREIVVSSLAFKSMYGLATLGRLPKNGNVLTQAARLVGSVFNIGLNPKSNKVAGVVGGVMRFGLYLFVFSPLFQKPVDAIMQKIFGKPYDRGEEERKKQLEAQANQIIPELGITQKELAEKIQKNPHALDKAQNDPELTKKLQQNPKLLLDLLDGKDINAPQAQTNKKTGLSEANLKYINSRNQNAKNPQNNAVQALNNGTNSANFFSKPKEEKTTKTVEDYDVATYIPSSAYTVKADTNNALQQELDAAFKSSDRLLKRAEKIIA